jgi:hypothetical protein
MSIDDQARAVLEDALALLHKDGWAKCASLKNGARCLNEAICRAENPDHPGEIASGEPRDPLVVRLARESVLHAITVLYPDVRAMSATIGGFNDSQWVAFVDIEIVVRFAIAKLWGAA